MLALAPVVALARERGVPVLVDAAAEEDLRRYVAAGVDLVAYSGGKAFAGPTSGFVAGRAALVAACRAQERGVARAMKVGKEAILGLLAAIEAYAGRDEAAEHGRQGAIVSEILSALGDLPHTRVAEAPDEVGRSIVRVALSPDAGALGFTATDLARALADGTPRVTV